MKTLETAPMENIHKYALELLENAEKVGVQKKFTRFDFDFILISGENELGHTSAYCGINGFKKVKIQNKSVGFSFTINKNDHSDIERMSFVFEVCKAARGDFMLKSFAKKMIPAFRKINAKYPNRINQDEYSKLDIHNKNEVIKFLQKITS